MLDMAGLDDVMNTHWWRDVGHGRWDVEHVPKSQWLLNMRRRAGQHVGVRPPKHADKSDQHVGDSGVVR